MGDRRIEVHDSKALGITTLCGQAVDGRRLFKQAKLGDLEAVAAAERELGAMLDLHDADVMRSWEVLVQRTIDELKQESARPQHPRCIEHDCAVQILHVIGRAEGKTVTASALLDGSADDHGRRQELLRSVALRVLEERGVTLGNHVHLYDDLGFELKTRA